MNINLEPSRLSDKDLLLFLRDLHALEPSQVHPENRGAVSALVDECRAEILRRVFLPEWNPWPAPLNWVPGE